jgi:ribonuclease HII
MNKPTFFEEQVLWQKGYKYIAGVDEVGRGCFAGPVVAAAVILPQDFSASNEINDSKVLSPAKRLSLTQIIIKHALSYSIAKISVEVIGKIGIGKATQRAFFQAIKSLSSQPDFILIDAFYIHRLKKDIQKPIIHGDSLSVSIAAASIIAKVYRDNLMVKLHNKYPNYNFCQNKGYGTKEHRVAIKNFGLTPHHRTSFNLSKYL